MQAVYTFIYYILYIYICMYTEKMQSVDAHVGVAVFKRAAHGYGKGGRGRGAAYMTALSVSISAKESPAPTSSLQRRRANAPGDNSNNEWAPKQGEILRRNV